MMLDLLLIASLLIFYLLGLTCLALAQDKHWNELSVYYQRPAWTTPVGWVSLALSLLLAWAYQGVAFGSLIWMLLLPPSGFALVLTLAWRPQWLRPLTKLLSR